MKLKFLLMPIVVIVSIVLIIWYIWPAWFDEGSEKSIVSINKQIRITQDELGRIKQRKSNVVKLNGSLQSHSDDRNLIFNYYPTSRKEEDIISKINHIAFSTGVYISDLEVKYGGKSVGRETNKLNKMLAIPKTKITPVAPASAITTKIKSDLNVNSTKDDEASKIISLNLSVLGNYDQIKNFLNSLYPIGFLSNIQSFEIKKDEMKKQMQSEEAVEENESNILRSNVVINFGYLSGEKDEITKLLEQSLFASDQFDFEAIDKNRALIMEKYPSSEIGESGEANPFFP